MANFGATPGSVQTFTPDYQITPQARVSTAIVTTWIDQLGAEVAGAIVGYDLLQQPRPAVYAEVLLQAKALVEQGVASWVLDAAYPERVEGGDQRYAVSLWERYKRGFDQLVARVTDELARLGPAPGLVGRDVPANTFPGPAFSRRMGW